MKAWLKRGLMAGVIFVILMTLIGILDSFFSEGACYFFGPSYFFGNCFIVPVLFCMFAILPVVALTMAITFILKKITSKNRLSISENIILFFICIGIIIVIIYAFFIIKSNIGEINSARLSTGIQLITAIVSVMWILLPLFHFMSTFTILMFLMLLIGYIIRKLKKRKKVKNKKSNLKRRRK